jgi:hypothetical protein
VALSSPALRSVIGARSVRLPCSFTSRWVRCNKFVASGVPQRQRNPKTCRTYWLRPLSTASASFDIEICVRVHEPFTRLTFLRHSSTSHHTVHPTPMVYFFDSGMPSLGELVLEWCFAWPNFCNHIVNSNDLGPCDNLSNLESYANVEFLSLLSESS